MPKPPPPPPDVPTALAEIGNFGHLVPVEHRQLACEVAALVLLCDKAVDPEDADAVIAALPARVRPTGAMMLISLRRRKPKVRSEVISWARVLLTFRSGQDEEWEFARRRK